MIIVLILSVKIDLMMIFVVHCRQKLGGQNELFLHTLTRFSAIFTHSGYFRLIQGVVR